MPAQERLAADDATIAAVYLRLVEELELVAFDRQAEILFDGHPLAQRLVHCRGEELEVVPPPFLGVIKRRVGVAQQGRCILAVVGVHADADARRDLEWQFVDQLRCRHHLDQPARQPRCARHVGQSGNDDDELVAAQPRDGLLLAENAAEDLCHTAQQAVADVVPKSVVDQLETVEVEEQERHTQLLAARATDRVADAFVEQAAVRQSGQCIVVREKVDVVLRALALGDVVEAADVVRHLALAAGDGGDRQPGREDVAVFAPIPDLAAPGASALDVLPHLAIEADLLPARGEQTRRAADDLVAAVASDRRQGRVDRDDSLPGIGDADARTAGREDGGCEPLRLLGAVLVDDSPDVLAEQTGGLDLVLAVRFGLVADTEHHAADATFDHRHADQPLQAGTGRRRAGGEDGLTTLVEYRRTTLQCFLPDPGQRAGAQSFADRRWQAVTGGI